MAGDRESYSQCPNRYAPSHGASRRKMKFHVREDSAARVVRAALKGVYAKDDVVGMVARAREVASRHDWPILYDLREAKPGAITSADIFWMPRRHPALQQAGASVVRVAALHDGHFTEMAAFWENAFRNAGLQAREFTDEAEAITWLRRRH